MNLYPAQGLWAVSSELLDIALGVEEMRQNKEVKEDFYSPLEVVTGELFGWGLESQKEFDKQILAIHACKEILQLRDGYDAWSHGKTTNDLYKAFHSEYHNLLKILSRQKDVNLLQAKTFCLLLSQWSGAEVMAASRRQREERHPFRRYAA